MYYFWVFWVSCARVSLYVVVILRKSVSTVFSFISINSVIAGIVELKGYLFLFQVNYEKYLFADIYLSPALTYQSWNCFSYNSQYCLSTFFKNPSTLFYNLRILSLQCIRVSRLAILNNFLSKGNSRPSAIFFRITTYLIYLRVASREPINCGADM